MVLFLQILCVITVVAMVANLLLVRSAPSAKDATEIVASSRKPSLGEAVRTSMMVVISVVVLGSSLYVILSGNYNDDGTQKWAFGATGTIMGFWLKPAS